jgi:hypothetical protein
MIQKNAAYKIGPKTGVLKSVPNPLKVKTSIYFPINAAARKEVNGLVKNSPMETANLKSHHSAEVANAVPDIQLIKWFPTHLIINHNITKNRV